MADSVRGEDRIGIGSVIGNAFRAGCATSINAYSRPGDPLTVYGRRQDHPAAQLRAREASRQPPN